MVQNAIRKQDHGCLRVSRRKHVLAFTLTNNREELAGVWELAGYQTGEKNEGEPPPQTPLLNNNLFKNWELYSNGQQHCALWSIRCMWNTALAVIKTEHYVLG